MSDAVDRPTLETSAGAVRGIRRATADGPVEEFLGIPYASAERFLPAGPPPRWTETRDALSYGPPAPQVIEEAAAPVSESDCLRLNVWRPIASSQRPIMIFIHGGGYLGGSPQDPATAGDRLAAKHDVIVISVAYRLGAFGFLTLDHLLGDDYRDSANLALLDLIFALRWVRDHAGPLGGDPDRITIFGQSAGGAATATLFGMPATEGLFRRAIVQSGTAERAQPPEFGVQRTADLLTLLGIPERNARRLLELPVEQIIAAQTRLIEDRSRGKIPTTLAFQPTIDGRWLPDLPYRSVAEGTNSAADLMVGTNVHESSGLCLPLSMTDAEVARLPQDLDELIAEDFPDRPELPDRYRAAFRELVPDCSAAELLGAYLTDRMQRQPSNRLLEARARASRATYSYLFTWERPEPPRNGATHSLELPFVFRQLDHPDLADDLGPNPPAGLADVLSMAWTSYATTGVPRLPHGHDWPEFRTPERPTLRVGLWLAIAHDPRGQLRAVLSPPARLQ